ncbi:MAG TPA: hypothetical protein VHC86_11965 [Opitutaceae bacterium]|nr:hypothetical protein [Opitutaceae bacterium]
MRPRRRISGVLLLGLLAAGALLRGQEPAPAAAQRASLDALDRVLGRLAALVARDDDPRHRASAGAALGDLRRRREALRASFDGSKCDDLKAEAILDLQRQAAWVRSAPAATSPGRK